MKKTTIYINETDLDMLKTAAFLYNCTISEVIRKGIKKVCAPDDPEIKQALKSLIKIQSRFKNSSEAEIATLVDEEIQEVRHGKKSRY